MAKNIFTKCANCKYVRADKNASEYSQKRCGKCEYNKDCVCRKKECVCGGACEYRGSDEICPAQVLKWEALECGNRKSEYYKSLLNVSPDGGMYLGVVWHGCVCGRAK